jgi:hypothetical protein
MTSSEAIKLARAGNPKAIAALMNHSLQPKGITVKTSLNGECLSVLLEAAQVPNQKEMVGWLKKGMINLGAPSIHTVKLYGRQTGAKYPVWKREFELILPIHSSVPVVSLPTASNTDSIDISASPETPTAESDRINEDSTEAEDTPSLFAIFATGTTVLGVIGVVMALMLNPGNANNPSQGYASFALFLFSFLFVLPLGVVALVIAARFGLGGRDK